MVCNVLRVYYSLSRGTCEIADFGVSKLVLKLLSKKGARFIVLGVPGKAKFFLNISQNSPVGAH